MANILATGPAPPSRAAMIGDALGVGMGQGIQNSFQQQRQNRQNVQKFEPIRKALESSFQGAAATPGQRMLQEVTKDPEQFAAFMSDPQGMQAAMSALQIGAVEEPEPVKFTRVVTGESTLNERFALGLPEGESARVEFTRDPTSGAITNASVLARFGGDGTQINIGEGESEEAKNLGRIAAERFERTQERAEAARTGLPLVERQLAALESGQFETGAFADARLGASRIAELLGVNPSSIPGLGPAASAEAIQASANDLAAQAASNLSRTTNLALTLLIDAVPNLSRSPEGNTLLAEMMKYNYERELEWARVADEYVAEHGTTRAPGQKNLWQMEHEFFDADQGKREEFRNRIFNILGEGENVTDVGGAVQTYRSVGEVDRTPLAELDGRVQRMTSEQWNALPQQVRNRIAERIEQGIE